jgi:hypothetical protein
MTYEEEGLKQFLEYLKENRHSCLELLKVCSIMGDSLNSRSDRHDKSAIMELTYADCLPEIKYKDEIGYDLIFRGWRISSKGQQQSFLPTKSITKEIAVYNTRNKDVNHERAKDFDLMLVTQTKEPLSIALATYEAAMKRKYTTTDQIKTRIHYGDLTFVIHPNDNIRYQKYDLHIKSRKDEFFKQTIKACREAPVFLIEQ